MITPAQLEDMHARRDRPEVFGIGARQQTHRGRFIGRRRASSARVGIVDARGIVRVVHARYVSLDWNP